MNVLDNELDEFFTTVFGYEDQLPKPQNGESTSPESELTIRNNTWQLPVDFFDKSYVVECNQNEYIPYFLKDEINFATLTDTESDTLKVLLNYALEEFINTLAKKGCIDDDYITKASFAHALTGRKVNVETIRVTWKRTQSSKDFGWLKNIWYIGRELYPRYIYDNKDNQIQKYDHIAKVFDLEIENISSEEHLYYESVLKSASSYANTADKFLKDAVDLFLKYVKTAIERPS